MPTDGKCPRCAYKAPVSCFVDAAEGGQLLQVFAELPYEVQKPFFKYLSLFRPDSGCAIQPSKAERLTRELVALTIKGYVTEKGKTDRPCSPSFWVIGMERMQELAANLDLPMKNHNYLRSIVYKLANQADAQREQQQRKEETDGTHRVSRPPSEEGLSEIMRKYIAQHGDPHDPEQ